MKFKDREATFEECLKELKESMGKNRSLPTFFSMEIILKCLPFGAILSMPVVNNTHTFSSCQLGSAYLSSTCFEFPMDQGLEYYMPAA